MAELDAGQAGGSSEDTDTADDLSRAEEARREWGVDADGNPKDWDEEESEPNGVSGADEPDYSRPAPDERMEDIGTGGSDDGGSSSGRRSSPGQKEDQIKEGSDNDTDPTPAPEDPEPGDGGNMDDGTPDRPDVPEDDPRRPDAGEEDTTPNDRRSEPTSPPDPGGTSTPDEPASAAPTTPEPEQGVEVSAEDQTIPEQAQQLEQEVISQLEGLESEDIRIVRDGDELEAELTTTGREALTAAELGLGEEDISITESGEIAPVTGEGRAQLNLRQIEQGILKEYEDVESLSIQQEEPGVFDVEVETPEGTEEFVAGPEAESFVEEQQTELQPERGVSGRNVPAPDVRQESEPTGREIDFGPAEDLVNRFEEATGIDVPETQQQRFETEESLPGEEIARDIGQGALEAGQDAGEFLFAEETGVASKSGTAAILREAGFEDAAAQTEQTIRNVGMGITTGVGALGQQATTLPYEVGEVTATAADEGIGETGAQLGQSAAEAAASGAAGAVKNPALTAGSAIGSAALSGGLFRATQGRPIAGRGSRIALQPIEEAAKVGASRGVIPTRAATAVPGVRRGQMGLETETEVESGTPGRIAQFRQEVERIAANERATGSMVPDLSRLRRGGETETEVESETRQVELEESEAISDIDREQALEQQRSQRELEQELNRIRRGEEERIDPEGTQEEFTAPDRGGGMGVSRGPGGRTARTPGQIGAGPRGPQQRAFRTRVETETETEAEALLEEAQAAEARIGDDADFALDTRPDLRAGALGALAGVDAMTRAEAAQESEIASMADADVFAGADTRTVPASEPALDIETELETGLETEFERELETETETESEIESEFERELEVEQEFEREFEIETETEMERESEMEARFQQQDQAGRDDAMAMPGDVATDVFKNIDKDLQDLAEDY